MSLAAFSPFVNGSCVYEDPSNPPFGASDIAVLVLGSLMMFWNTLLIGFVFYNRGFQPLTAKQPYCQLMLYCGKFFSFIHSFTHFLFFFLAGLFGLTHFLFLFLFSSLSFSSFSFFSFFSVQVASAGLWAITFWTAPFSSISPWACFVSSGAVSH